MFISGAAAQSIHRIACQGELARLDSLLQESSIHVQDDLGRSLLHWAVACRQKEVFDFLVDRGIDINAEDFVQETSLHVAVRFDREPYFDMLLDLQPNDEWKSKYGASLLEIAILKDNQKYIGRLIDIGVDIDGVNNRGSTPLEIAQRIGADSISEWLLARGADASKVRTFEPQGPYLGQAVPDLTPQMFAPNVISTEEHEFGSAFNARGTEFYYGVDVNGKPEIRYSELVDNRWSAPITILSHERYGYNDPFLSPDEKRLYFISRRAMDGEGELKDQDIWYVEREDDGWSQPINAGPNINSSGNEFYISFTVDGAMYFASNTDAPEERSRSDYDIYKAKFVDGEFQKAISLGDSINTNNYEADVYIAPDESYIIFCSTRDEGLGRGDLYISFKNPDESWSEAVNMGAPVNTLHHELCPFVTADGKYLFYTSNQDIYWIDAKIIEKNSRPNKQVMEIQKIEELDTEEIRSLVELSLAEGFLFLDRLAQDWATGKNRFDGEQESLYKIQVEGQVIGIGGINRSPYTDDEKVGRIRRFYIHPEYRRQGIGASLITRIIADHGRHYQRITLRTDHANAAKFYESLGFTKSATSINDTHQMVMPPAKRKDHQRS